MYRCSRTKNAINALNERLLVSFWRLFLKIRSPFRLHGASPPWLHPKGAEESRPASSTAAAMTVGRRSARLINLENSDGRWDKNRT
jgi:hypothetical protein